MKSKIISILITSMFLLTSFTFLSVENVKACGNTITVDDDGDGDYTSIQEALEAASSGDIIEVYSGTYVSNASVNGEIIIEKDNIVLRGLDQELGDGDDTGMPLIEVERNKGMHDDGIDVLSDNVEVCGFTINRADPYGMHITGDNSYIHDNLILRSEWDGLVTERSINNVILNNTIRRTSFGEGIVLRGSRGSSIIGNHIEDVRSEGLRTFGSHDNLIQCNVIINCHGKGVFLDEDSDNNIIFRNHIENNKGGISTEGFPANTIYNNNFVETGSSSGSDGYFNNSYPLGGNYWSNYDGIDEFSGENQDQSGSDGIGDTPHTVYSHHCPGDPWDPEDNGYWVNISDYYPLMNPVDISLNLPPTRPIISGETSGKTGTDYEYTAITEDPDGDEITLYEWDLIGDDSIADETTSESSITYSWDGKGTFSLRVRAIDEHGTTSLWSNPLSVTMTKAKSKAKTAMAVNNRIRMAQIELTEGHAYAWAGSCWLQLPFKSDYSVDSHFLILTGEYRDSKFEIDSSRALGKITITPKDREPIVIDEDAEIYYGFFIGRISNNYYTDDKGEEQHTNKEDLIKGTAFGVEIRYPE